MSRLSKERQSTSSYYWASRLRTLGLFGLRTCKRFLLAYSCIACTNMIHQLDFKTYGSYKSHREGSDVWESHQRNQWRRRGVRRSKRPLDCEEPQEGKKTANR